MSKYINVIFKMLERSRKDFDLNVDYVEFFLDLFKEFMDDRDFFLELVKTNQNFDVLKYAAENIKDDKEIAILALNAENNGWRQFKYISNRLKEDKGVVLVAIRSYLRGYSMTCTEIPDSIKDDYACMKIAVNSDLKNLKYASERIRMPLCEEFLDVILPRIKQNIIDDESRPFEGIF